MRRVLTICGIPLITLIIIVICDRIAINIKGVIDSQFAFGLHHAIYGIYVLCGLLLTLFYTCVCGKKLFNVTLQIVNVCVINGALFSPIRYSLCMYSSLPLAITCGVSIALLLVAVVKKVAK